MSIKKLFDKRIPQSIVSSTDLEKLGKSVESSGNIKQKIIEKNRFIPQQDYSRPETFAHFGSAVKYYSDSFDRIINQYPYDGSLKERTEFFNNSTYLDLYIYDNVYPRTTGYISISTNDYTGAHVGTPADYPVSNISEYILYFGGPHAAPAEFQNDSIPKQFPEANIYDPDTNRESNLEFNNDNGMTIEFWLLKPSWSPTSSATSRTKEVICDMIGSEGGDEVRNKVVAYFDLSGTPAGGFQVEQTDGSATASSELNILDYFEPTAFINTWIHYAVTSINSGSDTIFKWYVNGDLVQTDTDADTIISTNFVSGTLGALVAPDGAGSSRGDGKLTGSLDEFRYWKRARTSEEVGRYWFTQVGGGTNTDDANTDLGIYYKFNEGITGRTSTDSVILDYSGRLSNGAWTGYPGSIGRSTGSAMVISDAAKFEFKDPIIYAINPAVQSLHTSLAASGSAYDHTNNASMYHSMPNWIIDEDEIDAGGALKTLTQIMSSYLDALYLQIEALPKIRDMVYDQDHVKPAPFANKLLESYGMQAPELFVNADILAQILNRDEDREFEDQLEDIKNLIYKNIYNNLIYIYKSKGTMKSLRNLVHCYGVDEDLIRVNAYGNNVNYTLEDNFRPKAVRKKFADFNDTDRFQATVYQQTASGNPNSRNYIAGQGTNTALTAECEVIFPRKLNESAPGWFPTRFISSSIFGFHSASSPATDLVWGPHDKGLQVYAVRDQLESPSAYFQLTNTEGTVNLTSSLFYDIYDNKKWNLAFRLHREKEGVDLVDGSSTPGNYMLEFYGVNSEVDTVANEFYLTQSVDSLATGSIGGRKRFYVGAHYENFTGSLLTKSDLKISSLRYWGAYLNNDVIRAHARDGDNVGTLYPPKSAYLYPTGITGTAIPEIELLGLNWNFNNVTASGPGITSNAYDAGYEVQDLSSGSLALASDVARFGSFANDLKRQHTGRGAFYLANDPKVVDLRYVYSGKQNLPEVVQSSDMIQIMTGDDVTFTKESRPVDYYFQIEKSMYQTISDEMLNIFATIVDFNNLIGEPVNRYRHKYKRIEKLRQLFFERVENTPSLDKYVKFYEWIDASLNIMIQQLLPASANFSDDIRNMVESHILERNKYQTKFPTLEMEPTDPEAGLMGVNELLYNWKFGHAPISASISPAPQSENCFWWKERADRAKNYLSSGDTSVDFDKNQILSSSVRVLNRSYSTPYRFTVDESKEVRGGVSYSRNKKIDYVKSAIKFGSTTGVTVGEVQPLKDCDDVYNPWEKLKLGFKATTNEHSYFSGKGDIFVPFSLYEATPQSHGISLFKSNFDAEGAADPDSWTVLDPDTHIKFDTTASCYALCLSGSTVVTGDETTNPECDGDCHSRGATLMTPFLTPLNISYDFLAGMQSIEPYDPAGLDLSRPEDTLQDALRLQYSHDQVDWRDASIHLGYASDAGAGIWHSHTTYVNTSGLVYLRWFQLDANAGDDGAHDQWAIKNIKIEAGNITNLHTDTYGDDKDVPMQGPFTNYAVGGLQYRHVPFDSQIYLSEVFTSQSKFNDNMGMDPAIWSFNIKNPIPATHQHTGLRVSNTGDPDERTDNWICRLAGLDNTIGTDERWLETVRTYKCPLEVTFGYAQGDFQNVGGDPPTGYNLQKPNEGTDEDLLFQYSLDDGTTWITQQTFPCDDANEGRLIGWRIHRAKFPSNFPTREQGSTGRLKFRWYQEDNDGNDEDNWGLDFVRITSGKERPEGWEFKNNKFTHPPVTMYETVPNSGYLTDTLFQPYAPYYRDEIAKRPVNIRNIHHTTGSTIMGNYNAIYDVVQTCGRRTNNRAFVKAGGFNTDPDPITFSEWHYSEWILDIAAIEYAKIQRGRTPHVFVNRFSAPGGPDTAGDSNGGPGLDRYSGELSSNNDLNYRNNFVRQVLQWLQTSHVGPFGYYTNSQNINGLSGSVANPFNYAGTGSLYQVNRNTVGRIISGGLYNPPEADGTRYSCRKTYDNYYIQHAIPQSDCHYTWTTASVLGCECPTGYWPYDGMDGATPAVNFVSASDFGTYSSSLPAFSGAPTSGGPTYGMSGSDQSQPDWLFIDFVGLNTIIRDIALPQYGFLGNPLCIHPSVNQAPWVCDAIHQLYVYPNWRRHFGAPNQVGYVVCADPATIEFFAEVPFLLNSILLHRGGIYGWPTWKQIRGFQHPLVRYYRKNNIITCNGTPGPTRIFKSGRKGKAAGIDTPAIPPAHTSRTIIDRFGSFKMYREPAVTSQCAPIQHTFGLRTTIYPKSGPAYTTIEPTTIQSTLGNNLELFTNEELNYCSGLKQCNAQAYDTLKGMYLAGALNQPSNPIYSFIELVYRERVYPSANNAHQKINRERVGYENDFWKNSRHKRSTLGATKWGSGGRE